MTINLLDQPFLAGKPIRLPYMPIVEWGLMIMNSLFLVIGVLTCWLMAFDEGNWIYLFNPAIFIALFSFPQIHYIWKWRAASLQYDQNRDTTLLHRLPDGFIVMAYPIASIVWTLFFVLITIIQYTEFDGDWISIIVLLFFWIPFVTLGPIQFLFFYKIRGIQKRFKDNDKS